MVRNRQTPRLAVVALAAVLFGTVLIAASAAPVAAQDEKQELEVEYEYDIDAESQEQVTITLTLQNPDEIDEEISVRMYDYVRQEGFEDVDTDEWHPKPGAQSATVTYTRDFDSLVVKRSSSSAMVDDDGDWAVLTTDFSRVFDGDTYDVAKSYDLSEGAVRDGEHILVGSAESHTATTDTATISVFGAPGEMPENPQVVAERLADVSNQIETGVLDHEVTAYAVPEITGASGVAPSTHTQYTEMHNSVREGGNTWFHEYVHNTDGIRRSGLASDMQWFTEAYADYGAHLYGVRAGYGSYDEFVDGMQNWNQDDPVVLTNDDEWDDNQAEYNQGSRVLAAIDHELRTVSAKNEDVDATIDDVVAEMHERDTVDVDEFTTIVAEVSTNETAEKAETWITSEHSEDVFDPWGIGEFEELYVDAPEFDGISADRDAVGVHSDAEDPAQPVLLDENADTLVVHTDEPLLSVTVETVDGELVTETDTGSDSYATVDATKLDRATTYEVRVERYGGEEVATQYVSTLDSVEGAVPRNIDHEDGLHRDITGDGSLTNSDVNVFFANQHTPEMQAYPEAYDFDGDGEVGQSDVQQLFEEV